MFVNTVSTGLLCSMLELYFYVFDIETSSGAQSSNNFRMFK